MTEDDKKLLVEIHREVGVSKVKIAEITNRISEHIEFSNREFAKINQAHIKQALSTNEEKMTLEIQSQTLLELKEMHVAMREEIHILRQESHARLDSLEKPYELLRLFGKVLGWIGGIVGVGATVAKFLKMW